MQNAVELIESAYDQYADAIFRHCYLRLSDRERAKEIMQDAFIKAYEYAGKGNQIENVRALLYRIANNLIIDYVRKSKEMSLDALAETGFDPIGSDGSEVGRGLEEERMIQTLAKLNPEDRQLVVLRFVDELKPQEIGEMLGVAANTVSVRIHRALKELKSHLKKP